MTDDDIDKDYAHARNKLIPLAEKYANKKERIRFSGGNEAARAAWFARWNRAYIGKMNELAREKGL
jgi:hypothetical protein